MLILWQLHRIFEQLARLVFSSWLWFKRSSLVIAVLVVHSWTDCFNLICIVIEVEVALCHERKPNLLYGVGDSDIRFKRESLMSLLRQAFCSLGVESYCKKNWTFAWAMCLFPIFTINSTADNKVIFFTILMILSWYYKGSETLKKRGSVRNCKTIILFENWKKLNQKCVIRYIGLAVILKD